MPQADTARMPTNIHLVIVFCLAAALIRAYW
jgi:hypothetical protein